MPLGREDQAAVDLGNRLLVDEWNLKS